MRSIKHISIIGAGNVATHLGHALYTKGLIIDCVFSRKKARANKLAKALRATSINNLSRLHPVSHLYIIAVSDDAVEEVASSLRKIISSTSLLVHTSGSVSSKVLKHAGGVFYPLQSFSINRKINFKQVPFCIYSNEEKIEKKLMALARKLSNSVYQVDDDARGILHLTAVFASNFSNHMYHIANDICNQASVDFDILKPLINETAAKIDTSSPHDMQTGPARRKDEKTLNKHLKQLSSNKNYKTIYKLLSDSIKSNYK